MYTHYAIASFGRDGLQRGMYSRSCAYETPELARVYGQREMAGNCDAARNPIGMALVRVETRDGEEGGRSLLRETVLEVLREPA